MESSPKNCIRTSERYFLINFTDLVTHFTIFPNDNMSLGAKLNSLLRLTIIIFIILVLLKYKLSFVFLILAIIFNVGMYFKYKKEYE